jgi:23S rRNA (uracil1939-C5)-methyltransferase
MNADPCEATIADLGDRGDGVAAVDGAPVYIAGALPGERVRFVPLAGTGSERRGRLEAVLAPVPTRVAPACRHFGVCGGCAAQHMAPPLYGAWKQAIVAHALARRGFVDPPIAPLVVLAPGTRRRIKLRAETTPAGLVVGFHARQSHAVVAVAECPVSVPTIAALIDPLRRFLNGLPGPIALDVAVTATETGLDLVVSGAQPASRDLRTALAQFADATKLARVCYAASGEACEIVALKTKPIVRAGALAIELPPRSFLQPSVAGETALAGAVAAALGDAAAIADLFAGIGTFALREGGRRRVRAYDADAEAIAALAGAAGRTPGLRVAAAVRDLFRRPLASEELGDLDAVVFDPPRQGAKAQAAALAAAGVPTVVAVACDAGTFARDARILVDGGYAIERVEPIDQFPWTAEIELVATFRKARRRRRRR